jgi:hypothetical protein
LHALLAHLEDADFVGAAEAVLDRAQQAEGVKAFPLQLQHGVHHVLEHARAGDGPSLVTWPTRKTGTFCALASRSSAAAQSRTWLTVPAALAPLPE